MSLCLYLQMQTQDGPSTDDTKQVPIPTQDLWGHTTRCVGVPGDLLYSLPPPPASCKTSLWTAACPPGPGAGGYSCGPPQPANRVSVTGSHRPVASIYRVGSMQHSQRFWRLHLVSHFLDFAFIFVGPLQSFCSPLLLSIQLTFQLPHLGRMENTQA